MIKTTLFLLFCGALALSGADLKSKALLPVKWEKSASHAPLKLVENGKLNFAVVYDEKTEPKKMLKQRKSARIAAYTIADAFERTTGKAPLIRPCSKTARAAPAVPSGRNVMERPPLSSKVYISFCTTSVVSPTDRWNRFVCSNTGVRTSRKP